MGIVVLVVTIGFSMAGGATICETVRGPDPLPKFLAAGFSVAMVGSILLLWIGAAHLIGHYGWLGGL